MVTLPELERRLSRKIEARKGIQLSPEELDLLVVTGAYDTFRAAVAAEVRKKSAERLRDRSAVGTISRSET